MIRATQQAINLYFNDNNKMVTVYQGLKLNKIITKNMEYNKVFVQSLYGESIGILSEETIGCIYFDDIISIEE